MTYDVAEAVDDLRQLIARAEALAAAAEGLVDDVFHLEDDEDFSGGLIGIHFAAG